MQWKGIKVPVVVMALVVGLAAFWGGQWLYNRYNYERPLAKILGENKDVVSYTLNDNGPVLDMEVKLGKVDNLQQAYTSLDQSVQGTVGRRGYRITLKDNRDATLENVYYHARLAAFEAMDRGNYLEMENYISGLAGQESSRARVQMDQDHLYIQMDHGGSYLYEIIPRAQSAGTVSGAVERRGSS